jgi:hypothetical protein
MAQAGKGLPVQKGLRAELTAPRWQTSLNLELNESKTLFVRGTGMLPCRCLDLFQSAGR